MCKLNEKLEILKAAEECGELVSVCGDVIRMCMKTLLWGTDSVSPKSNNSNKTRMIEEMGDVLCHLKRTANALDIGWDEIQQRSSIKNQKVNDYHYGEK